MRLARKEYVAGPREKELKGEGQWTTIGAQKDFYLAQTAPNHKIKYNSWERVMVVAKALHYEMFLHGKGRMNGFIRVHRQVVLEAVISDEY